MNIVDRLEYSNIQEYRIGDTECENLVLKALQCGIGNIVIGSSALDLVSDMLEKENNDDIKINIAVSYPSGAYLTEAKVQEIEDLLEIGKKIDGFYAVRDESTCSGCQRDSGKTYHGNWCFKQRTDQ